MVQAVFQRHNDWIRDYVSHAPQRLVGLAWLPLPEVDAAIQELRRVARMGIRGVAIPCTPRPTSRITTRMMSSSGVRRKRWLYPSPCPSAAAARRLWACRRTGVAQTQASSATPWPTGASWPRSGNASAVASPPAILRAHMSGLSVKPAGSAMGCSASTLPPTGRAVRPHQTSPWHPARLFNVSSPPPLTTTPSAC